MLAASWFGVFRHNTGCVNIMFACLFVHDVLSVWQHLSVDIVCLFVQFNNCHSPLGKPTVTPLMSKTNAEYITMLELRHQHFMLCLFSWLGPKKLASCDFQDSKAHSRPLNIADLEECTECTVFLAWSLWVGASRAIARSEAARGQGWRLHRQWLMRQLWAGGVRGSCNM